MTRAVAHSTSTPRRRGLKLRAQFGRHVQIEPGFKSL